MNKKGLLSIGKLSKLTGAPIRCLRYYEELGILEPTFIDPDSQYRYYNFEQFRIVEAIQYCVYLDIPLKQFKNFLVNNEETQIDYEKMFSIGRVQINKKMEELNKKMEYAKYIDFLIKHGESLKKNQIICNYLPQEVLWIRPYEGNQMDEGFNEAIYSIVADIHKEGLEAENLFGLLAVYHDNVPQKYIFGKIWGDVKAIKEHSQIFVLPQGEYYCTLRDKSHIEDAQAVFPKQFEGVENMIVIEKKLFTGKFCYAEQNFELRCHIVS